MTDRESVLLRDVTKCAFEFDNVRTSNVLADSKFIEFFHVPVIEFKQHVYTITPHVYTHRPPEQLTEQMRVA